MTADIAKLTTDLKNVKDELEKSVNKNVNDITQMRTDLDEARGKLNILILKFDELLELNQKSKENKTNVIMQVIILVLASIITGIIGFVCTQVWTGVHTPVNHNTQMVEQK